MDDNRLMEQPGGRRVENARRAYFLPPSPRRASPAPPPSLLARGFFPGALPTDYCCAWPDHLEAKREGGMKNPAPGASPTPGLQRAKYCPTAYPGPSPDQSAIFSLGSAIGFACRALQSITVLHRNLPTGIRNQSLFSEDVQSFGHAGPADAKHERQKLVSER